MLVPRRATAATRLGTEERTQRTRRRCAPARLVRRWRSSRGWRRGARSPRCRGGVRRQECDSRQGRCIAGRDAPWRCTTMERVTSCKARRAAERDARVGWIRIRPAQRSLTMSQDPRGRGDRAAGRAPGGRDDDGGAPGCAADAARAERAPAEGRRCEHRGLLHGPTDDAVQSAALGGRLERDERRRSRASHVRGGMQRGGIRFGSDEVSVIARPEHSRAECRSRRRTRADASRATGGVVEDGACITRYSAPCVRERQLLPHTLRHIFQKNYL